MNRTCTWGVWANGWDFITYQEQLLCEYFTLHSPLTLNLNMNKAENYYKSDSDSQKDVLLMLPVFLSSYWEKNMLL